MASFVILLFFILPTIASTAVIGFVIYYLVTIKKKRENAMAALAQKQGWTAVQNDPAALSQYLPGYIQNLGKKNYGFTNIFTSTRASYDLAYQATVANHGVVFFNTNIPSAAPVKQDSRTVK